MKANTGNFFEDFRPGQEIVHATPRTLSTGDAALGIALYGSRFVLQSSDAFARSLGFVRAPLDDLLVFHIVFGKSVPDISLNAIANLGYAQGRFLKPVYPGVTLSARSQVIGLKENANRKTGIVHVRTTGFDETGGAVLSYVRWVMVRKRDEAASTDASPAPVLADHIPVDALGVPDGVDFSRCDFAAAGIRHAWEDYSTGEKIDHVDGTTIEEAEHQLATRLYQNTARVHFNQYTEGKGRFGRRLVYGGHVISIARALSYNGLEGALLIAAINAGRHANPAFAGDTIFAWSEVLDKAALAGRTDCGVLRLRLVATKNLPASAFPDRAKDGSYPENVILDFDYWAILPRRR